MLQRIVQLAAERGAFRADEMSSIGQCYDRLTAWLTQMAPAEKDPTPAEEPKGE